MYRPQALCLLPLLLLSGLPCVAHAVACSDIFSNVVGTTGGTLKLDNQPRLVNTGDRVLATDDLSATGKKADKICDGSPCSASSVPAPTAPLPANTSATDYSGNPLSFSAGDYYYKDFTLSGGQSTQLTVTSGTVRIHVSGKLVIDNTKANFSGEPEDLVFLVAGDVDIKGKAKIHAVIYSEGAVVISDSATQLTGAVTGHSVEVKDKATVTFDPGAIGSADFGGFCGSTTGTPVDADAFNCVATGAAGLNGHLYLQTVGNTFGFDVVALKDSDGNGSVDVEETAFASDTDRTVTVELVDTSSGLACAAHPALTPAVNQDLTFTAGDAGRKAAASVSVGRAYQSLGCRITDSTAVPAVVACSTDTFGVRPTSFILDPPLLNNSGATGVPKAMAGSSFALSVTAVAGYTGTPKIDASRVVAHGVAVQTGVLSGGFGAATAAAGIAAGSGFSYSEVGNFRFSPLGLYDDTFAAVDAANGDCTNDFSNVRVGGLYGCNFGNTSDSAWIGRFHPASFSISTQFNGSLADTCVSGGFSYQGQEVPLSGNVVYRVTALNSGGNTTRNYTGGYAKLSTGDFTFAAVTSDGSQMGADGVNEVGAAWSTAGSRTLIDNADGTLDLSLSGDRFTWGRSTNDLVAPFITDLDISITAVVDADGVTAVGLPEIATPTGVDMRYGRVALTNAHGSELQNLAMPMRVEYFAGSAQGFALNSADSCTSIASLVLTDLDTSDGLDTTETCVWDVDNDSGLGCPGAGPSGTEFESSPVGGLFNLNLKASGSGNTGVLGLDVLVPPHLRYNWTGSGDTDPTARATFGIFNKPSTIIFRREVR